MQQLTFETPIVFMVFNRPSPTQRVFDAIAKVRPARLLLIADGPRADRPEDAEACRQVREILKGVDWPCEVSTNFADANLGCGERVISGLNWAFSLVEEAIILEDDCLPDPSFFEFCRELLDKYRNDNRVAAISGTCLVEKHLSTDASYYFSQLVNVWGWATWRTRWQGYERHLESWPRFKNEDALSEIFSDRKAVLHWTRIFDAMHQGRGPDTWDYQWVFSCFKNNSLIVVPRVNLVANIGFGVDATHTFVTDKRYTPPVTPLSFPLIHPVSFAPRRSADRKTSAIYRITFSTRVVGKIRRMIFAFRTKRQSR